MADLSKTTSFNDSCEESTEKKDIFSDTSDEGVPNFVTANSTDIIKVKVVVVGDMSVGKTSLAVRFTQNKFDSKYTQTVGASFYVRAVDAKGKKIIFQIWDTAGQERFRSLVPMYLRDAAIALVVYDVTDKDSFNNVRNWAKELRISAPDDTIITLIGNKADLLESKRVHVKDAEEFANATGIKFIYETSAKTGKNVEPLFHDLALAILHSSEEAVCIRDCDIVDLSNNNLQKRSKCCHH